MFRLLICLLIPIASGFQIKAVGSLTAGEIMLLLLIPFVQSDLKRVWKQPLVKKIVYALAIYLVAQVAVDFFRGSASSDYLRGWARVSALTLSFLVLAAIIQTDRRRIFVFAVSGSVAGVILLTLSGDEFSFQDTTLFKFVFGGVIAVASFLCAGYGRKRIGKIAPFLPFLAGFLAFFMNARSLAGITMCAAIVPFIVNYRDGQSRRLSWKVVWISLGLLIGGLAIFQTYQIGASSGLFGSAAKEKYEIQIAESRGKGVLLGGRKEIAFSWPKIAQSPIVGWGSWARDRLYVRSKFLELGVREDIAAVVSATGLIPTHSHLFGAWVEVGLIGALFWAIVLFAVIRVLLLDGFAAFGELKPLLIYLFVYFAWDILFSPFGGARRVWNGFLLWILVLATIYLQMGSAAARGAVVRRSAARRHDTPARSFT